jgi:hypothetical protein
VNYTSEQSALFVEALVFCFRTRGVGEWEEKVGEICMYCLAELIGLQRIRGSRNRRMSSFVRRVMHNILLQSCPFSLGS